MDHRGVGRDEHRRHKRFGLPTPYLKAFRSRVWMGVILGTMGRNRELISTDQCTYGGAGAQRRRFLARLYFEGITSFITSGASTAYGAARPGVGDRTDFFHIGGKSPCSSGNRFHNLRLGRADGRCAKRLFRESDFRAPSGARQAVEGRKCPQTQR